MQGNAANATLSGQAAQGMMQTEMAKGQAMQQALGGMGQMAGQMAGFSMLSGMLNKPTVAGGGAASAVNSTGLTQFADPSGNTYLVNKPR